LQEERALREKAEARNAELRKKLKEAKGEAIKPPEKAAVGDEDAIRQSGDSTSKNETTNVAGGNKDNHFNTPSNTPTKPTGSNIAPKVSPSSQSPSSETIRKPGNSMTRSSMDTTKNTTNLSLQKETENCSASALNKNSNDSNRASLQTNMDPLATIANSGSGTEFLGVRAPSEAPESSLAEHAVGQGTVSADKPANSTPKAPSQLKKAEENQNAADASSRIMKSFNAMEDEAGPNRNAVKDSSAGTLNQKVLQQAPLNNSETAIPSGTVAVPSSSQQPERNGVKASLHRPTRSLHDFDPLSSHHVTSNSDTMLPVISIPPSYSLGAAPINTAPPTGTNPITDINGTFMSPNPFMVPVAFEMAAATTLPNEQQPLYPENGTTLMGSDFAGFQHQQFMVVPQQHPIMLQPVGSATQQMADMGGGQWVHGTSLPSQQQTNSYQQPPAPMTQLSQQHPTQFQQQPSVTLQQHQATSNLNTVQPTPQSQHQSTSNPFDPLSKGNL
jgi:hypothetical protein